MELAYQRLLYTGQTIEDLVVSDYSEVEVTDML